MYYKLKLYILFYTSVTFITRICLILHNITKNYMMILKMFSNFDLFALVLRKTNQSLILKHVRFYTHE